MLSFNAVKCNEIQQETRGDDQHLTRYRTRSSAQLNFFFLWINNLIFMNLKKNKITENLRMIADADWGPQAEQVVVHTIAALCFVVGDF